MGLPPSILAGLTDRVGVTPALRRRARSAAASRARAKIATTPASPSAALLVTLTRPESGALAERSDILSIHLALTSETRGLVGEDATPRTVTCSFLYVCAGCRGIGQLIKAELERWARVIKESGAKVD